MTTTVALVGFSLEANSLAPRTRREDGTDVRRMPGGISDFWEARPCVEELRRRVDDLDIVEGPFWLFPPGGPLVLEDFQAILDETSNFLRRLRDVDAIVVFGHGAAITDDSRDADGRYLQSLRDVVGCEVPIVCILDFHANLSGGMVEAADVLVGYRTNPHVDVADRAVEAAIHVTSLLSGVRTVRSWCHVPMRVPQIAQLTSGNEPFGVAVDRAVGSVRPGVLNVSVFAGFSLADTVDARAAVVVTAEAAESDRAAVIASDVAATLWGERHRCRVSTTSIADAVEMVRESSEPWILSDGSDNPGGGAPGNTVHLIRALVGAGIDGVHSAVHIDPQVVEQAWSAGIGSVIHAEFNSGSASDLTGMFDADATVLSIGDGHFVPRQGVYSGATLSVGRWCALQIGGAVVGVGSRKLQCADPDTMRHVGCDPDNARVIVVKSRGHFRAGFSGFVSEDHIIDVGAPGVSTNDLESVTWAHAPTDVFPFVDDAIWDGAITTVGACEGR